MADDLQARAQQNANWRHLDLQRVHRCLAFVKLRDVGIAGARKPGIQAQGKAISGRELLGQGKR